MPYDPKDPTEVMCAHVQSEPKGLSLCFESKMEGTPGRGTSYGGSFAGADFDIKEFLQRPQTIVRLICLVSSFGYVKRCTSQEASS